MGGQAPGDDGGGRPAGRAMRQALGGRCRSEFPRFDHTVSHHPGSIGQGGLQAGDNKDTADIGLTPTPPEPRTSASDGQDILVDGVDRQITVQRSRYPRTMPSTPPPKDWHAVIRSTMLASPTTRHRLNSLLRSPASRGHGLFHPPGTEPQRLRVHSEAPLASGTGSTKDSTRPRPCGGYAAQPPWLPLTR